VIRSPKALSPMTLDVVAPDKHTSLLPDSLRLVLHVNPQSVRISHKRVITRKQTLGGHVIQHWGEQPTELSLEASSGGFVRLYSGYTSVTGTELGGSRRDTIAYDRYLDLLALYRSNGAIYDRHGHIVLQGQIKLSFDGAVYYGVFSTFSVTEDAQSPYQFRLSFALTIDSEQYVVRS
jgi:hypothetical protein